MQVPPFWQGLERQSSMSAGTTGGFGHTKTPSTPPCPMPTPQAARAWHRGHGVLTNLAVLPGEALGTAAAADGAVGTARPAVQARVVLARIGRSCGVGAGAVTRGTPVLRPHPPHCPHGAAPSTGTPTQPHHQPQLLAGSVGTAQTHSWPCPRALAHEPRRLFHLSVALNLLYFCSIYTYFFPRHYQAVYAHHPSPGAASLAIIISDCKY